MKVTLSRPRLHLHPITLYSIEAPLFYEVGRIIQIFFRPFTLTFICLVVGLIALHREKYRVAKGFIATAVVILFIFSIPLLPYEAFKKLERVYPVKPIKEYPEAGAIVVMGGTTAPAIWPRYEPQETGGRLLPAARLFHSHRANLIVVTGSAEYTGASGEHRSQTGDMKQILVEMGVPAERVLEQSASRNTQEDVQISADLIFKKGITTALLVTNAFHMHRAMAFADRTKVKFTPVPVAHECLDLDLTAWAFLPEPDALSASAKAIKELIGYTMVPWYQRFRAPATISP